MITKLVASTGLTLLALFGCQDLAAIVEPAGEVQVVYVDGEPDHCIVVPAGTAKP